jgi:hypothetical protein
MNREHATFWLLLVGIAALTVITWATVSPTAASIGFLVMAVVGGWGHEKLFSTRVPRRH